MSNRGNYTEVVTDRSTSRSALVHLSPFIESFDNMFPVLAYVYVITLALVLFFSSYLRLITFLNLKWRVFGLFLSWRSVLAPPGGKSSFSFGNVEPLQGIVLAAIHFFFFFYAYMLWIALFAYDLHAILSLFINDVFPRVQVFFYHSALKVSFPS